ncbi:ComEC/Rec2 family competence protein [Microbacterium sp. TPD7012]|uniref:ComEC/Rec2 family competence protein n=1 Tax=Microbacterium sp. TPD7012 TaxID=2171975 RepID=UPI001FAE9F6B|nr:ComEC/Rec2 family competence protein [Microbacterium sp. TPD7012]
MRPRDLRLLPLAAAVWCVALFCVFVPGSAWGSAAICGIAAVSVLGAFSWRRRHGGLHAGAGLLMVTLAAGAAVAMSTGFASPARDRIAEWDGRVVEVVAEVTSSASTGQDGRLWFEAVSIDVGPPGQARPLAAPVRIGIDPADGFDLGARIRVTGEAAATDAGERSALVVFGGEAEVVSPAAGVFGAAAALRLAFVERSLRLPDPGSGLLPGLAVGDTRAVTQELTDDMRTSGLSHLTAVSGANCAIVVGAVFWLTALCGGGRMLRVVLAAMALAGFVVLVTPEPSVIRASVMAGVAMLTVLLGRPTAGAGMLALCVVVVLLADPWLAATPGFALSVVASGALILLAPPLSRGMTRWMPAPVALAIAVPLAAQLACGPIIALFAEQQSLIGIAANLLAAPAAPVATVMGLLACLAAPIPPLADLLTASAWLPAAWIATTATTTAQLPIAQILLPAGLASALLVLAVGVSMASVLIGWRGSLPPRVARVAAVARQGAAGVLIVTLSLAGAHFALSGPLATSTAPDGWSIAACDVGQGDALLVRSAGQVALIDTGPEPGPLAECLASLGIQHVDLLVLSHFDLDHVGGTAAVFGKVDAVLHGPTAEPADERLLDDLVAGGARLTPASAGLRGRLGSAAWRVLWPIRDSAAFPPGNDASVVVDFDGGGVPRSLFLGDLAAEPQRMLLRTVRLGTYAVVKVAHHGSADQDPGLYEAVRATAAIFSAGAENDYGHPRDAALDMLTATGAHNLRTDTQGRILLGIRDEELQVWTER